MSKQSKSNVLTQIKGISDQIADLIHNLDSKNPHDIESWTVIAGIADDASHLAARADVYTRKAEAERVSPFNPTIVELLIRSGVLNQILERYAYIAAAHSGVSLSGLDAPPTLEEKEQWRRDIARAEEDAQVLDEIEMDLEK